ncbi:N-acetyl-glucosamine-6-phosphate deacetylase [Orbilia oligospora]|uniref:Beta-hexosaminidase n=1 Tax=Orbilia oligospora TaxID=2813651 RepID=A0A7C8UCW7_ORBOL|nr:N-acetyl-glucosamine-6-phosphate deacetylase [Orbilia oligospora]
MVRFNLLIIATSAITSMVSASVWPLPKEQSLGDQVAWLDGRVKFNVKYGPAGNSATYKYTRDALTSRITRRKTSKKGQAETRIDAAIDRAKSFLYNDNLVPWMFNKKGTDWQPHYERKTAITIKTISVTQTDVEPDNSKDEPIDESYTLTISKINDREAKVEIVGKTSVGVLHGLTSLSQLFYTTDDKKKIYTPYFPVSITDSPRFPHRGLNLDVARSFYPVKNIKSLIDVLSWNKMNVLHIHITESQSWPLEIRSMPDLAAKGAYTKDQIYSVRDIDDIYSYAALRGIKVIIEIDMPGHTASIAYSRPELIANFNKQPWVGFCAQPPCGQFKLDSPAVDKFVEELFADLLPRLKASGAGYFHAGGDEYNSNSAQFDETVGSNDSTIVVPKLNRFVNKVHKEIFDAGFTPIAWEEMLLEYPLTLDPRVIIQAWIDNESVKKIVDKGHRVIFGNYKNWYLDCGFGFWLDVKPESFNQLAPAFTDYCSPMKNWKAIYYYDALEGIPKDKLNLVLGGEVHMWSEQVDGQILDARVWPRASAAAEVLWSWNREESGEYRTQLSVTPRLALIRERMVARGVQASLVTQGWCLQNPGDCQY